MNRNQLKNSWWLPLFVLAAGLPGCTKIDAELPRNQVVARFDPTTSTVPTPTDLARDSTAGRLKIPTTGVTGAQLELYDYLNTKVAWPSSSGGEVSFGDLKDPKTGGVLDEATINEDTVLVYDATTAMPLPALRVLSPEKNKLFIDPSSGAWPRGHTILMAVRGGERGVKGADGLPVEAEAAFHFLRGTQDIREHFTTIPGKTTAERKANAAALEAVRQSYEPLFAVLASRSADPALSPEDQLKKGPIQRSEVAVLWSFTVEPQVPEVIYDPLAGAIPLPNSLLFDANGKISIPIDADTDPGKIDTFRGLNTLFGFSTSASIFLEATDSVDPTTLNQAVKVYKLEAGGALTEVQDLRRRVNAWADDAGFPDRMIVVDPWAADAGVAEDKRTPLEPKSTYLVTVNDTLRQLDGGSYAPQIFAQLVKFRNPFTKEGKSTVTVLDDASAATVERARTELAPLLDTLEARGVQRSSLLAAFSFRTEDQFAELRKLADLPWQRAPSLSITDVVTVNNPNLLNMPGLVQPLLNTAAAIRGKIRTADMLNRVTRKFAEDGGHTETAIDFALCIPAGANATTPIPVIIVAHELTMGRDLAFTLCDDTTGAASFSAQGYATLVIDLPYHGNRTQCVRKPAPDQNIHCAAGSTCGEDGFCRNGAGQVTPIVTRAGSAETLAWAGNFAQPSDDAQTSAFLESDLFAIRDHFRQAIVDLSAVQRSLLKANWAQAVGYNLSGNDTVALGYGFLGGAVAADFAGADPRVKAVALNTAGSGIVSLLQDSQEISAQLVPKLAARGIVRGNRNHFDFEFAARWALDQIDPANNLRFSGAYDFVDLNDSATKTGRARKLYSQGVTTDTVTPFTSVNNLRRVGRVTNFTDYSAAGATKGGHGAILDPTNTNLRNQVRTAVITFFNGRNANQ